jgi:hypothetical protein
VVLFAGSSMITVLYLLSGITLCGSIWFLLETRSRLHRLQGYQEILRRMPTRSLQLLGACVILIFSYGTGSIILGRLTYSLILLCVLCIPFCYFLIHSFYIDASMTEVNKSNTLKFTTYAKLYRRCSLLGVISLVLMQLTLFL